MPYFTKKPVQIEARQYDGTMYDAFEHANWIHDGGHKAYIESAAAGHFLIIVTLEGEHRANPGDWIIKGVAGEFYPCKPDIFAATYEPVNH